MDLGSSNQDSDGSTETGVDQVLGWFYAVHSYSGNGCLEAHQIISIMGIFKASQDIQGYLTLYISRPNWLSFAYYLQSLRSVPCIEKN